MKSNSYTQIIKDLFDEYKATHLTVVRGGPGIPLASIKSDFEQYLADSCSPITSITSIRMGLLMKSSSYVVRRTSKGAHYLVSLSTVII